MKQITTKDVLKQLRADLIGKDSYRGVTLTYSWLANQVGHFSLGFIPTLLVSFLLTKYSAIKDIANWSAAIVSLMWLSFELYNFLAPLLIKNNSSANYSSNKEQPFSPPWANVAFDTFTDLCFFWLGAFFASLFLHYSTFAITVVVVLLIILIYPTRYWYLTKMYLQSAQYPFQFRLSQWEGNISKGDKEYIDQFLKIKDVGNHLFVFGAKESGKTSISVGIGSEMSINRFPCLYTTGVKLLSKFFEQEDNFEKKHTKLWSWRNTSLIVIDDINHGDFIKRELIPSNYFLEALDTCFAINANNREALKNKNAIWVLGDQNFDQDGFNKWKTMLVQIGVDPNKIVSVYLL